MSQVKARKSHKTKSRHASSRSQTNFPLLVVLGGFVLVAAALFALWKTGQPAAASVPIEVQGIPSLKVNQEKIDFGDIKLGRTVTASFTLSNVGDKILRITEDPYVDVVEGC